MKQIKQETTTLFSAINFQDAIKLLPIMDMLTSAVNAEKPLKTCVDAERSSINYTICFDQARAMLEIMEQLGFASQIDRKVKGDDWEVSAGNR